MRTLETPPVQLAKFPKPDRSDFRPNSYRNDEWPEFDLGWQEGVLPDGRPFRVEFWARDNSSFLTFFVPAEGIDLSGDAKVAQYLEQAGLVRFLPERMSCSSMKFKDPSGNEVWSMTAVVGDEYRTCLEDNLQLRPYAQSNPCEAS